MRCVCAIASAVLSLCVSAAFAAPTTQPSASTSNASVAGIVKAESEVPLSEMVIYLEPAEGAAPIAAPATQPSARVSQKEAQFAPRLLVVTVGQAVEFVNDEDRPIEHNVFSNSPTKKFDLGLYGPGQSKTVTFDKPGPVFLYCSIHRYMDGVVFVSPTPYTSRVSEDGKYKIENVPPGKWVLKTWQRRKRFMEKTMPVTVETGKTAAMDMELTKR